jgi:segregation and condensation protein A
MTTAPITNSATPPDQPFLVELDAFSGPLDLLLHLIREQEIDIADIPIAKIADQFRAAIEKLGLNQAADYLDMAAWLLRIKIQMLLPRPFDAEEWEDPRAELVRRLLEYEQVREVVGWLVEQAGQRADRFPRGWLPPEPDLPLPPITCDVSDLLQAVHRVLEAMPQPVLHRVVPRPLDVEGATKRIVMLLESNGKLDFHALVGETPTVVDLLSVLLALLELARVGRVRLTQPALFGNMDVVRESADQTA